MKKLIAIFILVFIIGSMLSGCYITDFDKGNNNPAGSNPGEINDPDQNITPDKPTDPDPIYTVGTTIGSLMKTVELNKIDGSGTVSVEDYRGKIIIFNLWATWCPPCVSELPHFSDFASDYASDVVIIAAHVSDRNQNAYSYVLENFQGSKIVFAYDTIYDAAYLAAGGNGFVPYTVILDRNGVIVYSDSGPLTYQQLKQYWEQYK